MSGQSLAEQLAALGNKPVIATEPEKEPAVEPKKEPEWALNGKAEALLPEEQWPIRTKLWDDGVVSAIILPNTKIVDSEYLEEEYLMFQRKVRGRGFISCHVRGEGLPTLLGSKITARCEVWEKKLKSGMRFLYIDLYPIDGSPTHKLEVVSYPVDSPDEGQTVFPVHKPQVGGIVLTPIM